MLRQQVGAPRSGVGPMNYRGNIDEALERHAYKCTEGIIGVALLVRCRELAYRLLMHFFIKEPHPDLDWDASREQDVLAVWTQVLCWEKCADDDSTSWIYDEFNAPSILEQLQKQQSVAASMHAMPENDECTRAWLHGPALEQRWILSIGNEAMRLQADHTTLKS